MKEGIMEPFTRASGWEPPPVDGGIPQGDMPGDKINIGQEHIRKAGVIFPELLRLLPPVLEASPHGRGVVAVCGGSGVGKSETASILGHYFRALGIGAYVLSGDNYPHRIPAQNDAERLRVFRHAGVRGLVAGGGYGPALSDALRALQAAGRDAGPALIREYPWMEAYQREGRRALAGYLGSQDEIGFAELNGIIARFRDGAGEIFLKRMGRDETALWYDSVSFTGAGVLIIEWTHGNSGRLRGVDIPVLLASTPRETLAYRRARNRDGAPDSPFTAMVLEIEQKQLEKRAPRAKIIVSRDGRLITISQYRRMMAERGG